MTVVRPPVGVCSAMAAVLAVLGTERQVKELGLLSCWCGPRPFRSTGWGPRLGQRGKLALIGGG